MRSLALALLVAAPVSMLLDLPAAADERGRGGWRDHGGSWRGPHHDLGYWRSGNWRHGRYGNRLGWWWGVGGYWYFYPARVYPYPDPDVAPIIVQQSPPTFILEPGPPVTAPAPVQQPAQPTWYYCEAAKAYYPYVKSCAGGWISVAAVPPAPPVEPAPAMPPASTSQVPAAPQQSWYYCDATGAYYPYVTSCPAGWKVVPATPSAPAQ